MAVRRSPLAVVLVALVVGCGDDSKDESSAKKGPVPASLRTVESASEDIIDLALAGKRSAVIRRARELDAAASGPAQVDLEKVGVGPTFRHDFESQAARVNRMASSAPLLEVALASNRVFQKVPYFFSLHETSVPPQVTWLDYLEFQAKLKSKARDPLGVHRAVVALRRNWDTLRPDVTHAQAIRHFDAHLKSLTRLADNANPKKTQREAQHGLDLVDELEQSFGS